MRRLMFTGGGGAGNEAIYRLWRELYDVRFADADVEAIDPAIPAERRFGIPFASDAEFPAALADICREQRIDILIPGVDEELPLMPAVADAAPNTAILVPGEAFVNQSMDKLATARALAARGLSAPRSATLDDAAAVGFPCFAKPRSGRGSRGVRVLADKGEAEAYLRLSGLKASEILVQELLVGREFTVLMAADREGRLHAVVPVEVAIKRGITIRARTVSEPSVTAACHAVHEAFAPGGCYNIQLILTEQGRALPFEINPRVSTTFCLGIAAGVDPIEIYFRTRASRELSPVRDGLELHRHWTNVIH